MSTLNTALGKLHEIVSSWDDQNKAMDIVGWYNNHMVKEFNRYKDEIHRLRGRLSHYETPSYWSELDGDK